MSFQLAMQSRMVESDPCFYMLCSFIHTLEENAIPFKDDVEKMDLFIKCLSTRKQNFACVGAFHLMRLLLLKLPKEQSLISANIFPKQRHDDSFLIRKIHTLVFISKY